MVDGYEEAKVSPTIMGIDKEQFYQMSLILFVLFAIILGRFLGVLVPKIRDNPDTDTLLGGDGVFDPNGPKSLADRIAALEWLTDDIGVGDID